MPTKEEAKKALENLIKKSRVHLYKPIQIAEILYRDRITGNINLLDPDDYRTKSKKWRDDISMVLLGRVCTSSAKFQDNLFDKNAIPPEILNVLGQENRRTNGAVEAFIYNSFQNKHQQLTNALNYCNNSSKDDFNVKQFIDSFWKEPGLKRSLDKIYEIIVYGLFATLVDVLNMRVEISLNPEHIRLLEEFEDFTQKILCIDFKNTTYIQDAKVYRVGVTNAADRGLDMYSNWGPAIQIKHLTLDIELAEDIVNSVSSDRIVIVCKDVEKEVIIAVLKQIGWASHIQSVVTEQNLIDWYEKALRGKYAPITGDKLLDILRNEIAAEFPSTSKLPEVLVNRHYEKITDSFWR